MQQHHQASDHDHDAIPSILYPALACLPASSALGEDAQRGVGLLR